MKSIACQQWKPIPHLSSPNELIHIALITYNVIQIRSVRRPSYQILLMMTCESSRMSI
jgi:hypothetical protein